MRWTVAEAAQAMDGRWTGAADAMAAGAAIDSRAVTGDELFFALPGERTDGHRFVAAALAAGAAAAVVSRTPPADAELPAEAPLIEVDDPEAALHALTRAARDRAPDNLVAITGSAGKTTTKELLAAMLGRRFRVARSPGNFNNLLGFPLALLAIPDDTEWMVAEMGMSVPGELSRISQLGRPDVALFTNVRPVHLESFADLDAIARAKAELLDGLAPGGTVVANAADPRVAAIARDQQRREAAPGRGGRVVWYRARAAEPTSEGEPAVRAESVVRHAGGSRFDLVTPDGERTAVELPLLGDHNLENCVAAAACAWALGVPLTEIAAAAAAAEPAAGRGRLHELPGDIRVLDDSYNSNPEALAYALETLAAMEGRRRWAVLGDMLELGPAAADYHREAGALAARLGIEPVLAVGELARELAAGARDAGAETVWLPDATRAAAAAAERLEPGDAVLVKGSRGIGLEVVVQRLADGPEAATAGCGTGEGG